MYYQDLDPNGFLCWILSVNWLHFCVFLFLFCICVIALVSIFTQKPEPAQLQGLTYGSASSEQIAETRASWNKWDAIHSFVILGVVIVFYLYFW